jgi:hypothetical protein
MMSRVTRRIAVWLFITESRGLESTRTSPNSSSRRSVTEKLRFADAYPMTNGLALNPGVTDVVGGIAGCRSSMPVFPARSFAHSMPRWYSLRSWTSATVASISTWRLAPAST